MTALARRWQNIGLCMWQQCIDMDWGHAQWRIVPLSLESTGLLPVLPVYKHTNRDNFRNPFCSSNPPSAPPLPNPLP